MGIQLLVTSVYFGVARWRQRVKSVIVSVCSAADEDTRLTSW